METKIAIGILFNHDKTQVYITQRFSNVDEPNLWEFPGGKVERDESPIDGLKRELQEEIGIDVITCHLFETVSIPKKEMQLYFYTISHYNTTQESGQPEALQARQGRWVVISDLLYYSFPSANIPIIKKIAILY